MYKSIKRIITALSVLLLAFSLSAAWSVLADDDVETDVDKIQDIFKLDGSIPDGFNKMPASAYDNIGDTPFLLSEQNELFFLWSDNTNREIDIFDTVNLSKYSTDLEEAEGYNILDNSINRASAQTTNSYNADAFAHLTFVQGTSFDPTGSGRRDHVAVIGLQSSGKNNDVYKTVVIIQNTITKATYTVVLDSAGWMSKLVLWNSSAFFSITAGDYDHDGKDTVVAYAAGDSDFRIYEISLDYISTSNTYVASKKAVFNPRDVLQNSIGDKIYQKPIISVTTGDFDGDGCDELGFSAGFCNTSGSKDGTTFTATSYPTLEAFTAYVGVLDRSSAAWSLTSGFYMVDSLGNRNGSDYYRLIHSGAVTAGDIDGKGRDELLVVGYTSKDANISYNKKKKNYTAKKVESLDTENYAYSIISYNGTSYSRSAIGTIPFSALFRHTFSASDCVQPAVSLACARVNGIKAPEAVFVAGCVYSFEKKPTLLYEGEMGHALDSILGGLSKNNRKASSINWVQNVTVGNFDGNDAGREQFVFVLYGKNSKDVCYSANLGVIAGVDYADKNGKYGTTSSFASSIYIRDAYYNNRNILDKSSARGTQVFVNAYSSTGIPGRLLLSLPIAIDNDGDGLLARQGSRGYVYTDPEVLAVLEAGPYYAELDANDFYLDPCETTYSIETSYGYSSSTGDNVSFGAGFAGEIAGPGAKVALEMGYSMEWSSSIEEAVETSYSTEFAALQSDIVVISRTPEVIYCYDIFKNGEWVSNGYSLHVPMAPTYFLLTVDDYNQFVGEYNDKIEGTNGSKLNYITNDDLPANHIGNPLAYWDSLIPAGSSGKQISQSSATSTVGGGNTASTWSSSASKTESQEISHGFSYSLTMSVGAEFGVGEAWAGGYVNLDWSRSSGSSSTTTKTNGAAGKVQNPDKAKLVEANIPAKIYNQYHFTWIFARWTRTLQTGKAAVPFYGYILSDVGAPSIPVSDLDAEFASDDDGKMVVRLSWSDPGDQYRPTQYFIIYLYDENGEAQKLSQVKGDATEFIFDGIDGRTEYKFTIVSKSTTSKKVSMESEPAVVTVDSKAIYDISLTSEGEDYDEYAISYTDGTVTTFKVKHGKQGLSAYDIAVKNGFKGSETDWLESLKGEKGDRGYKGDKGDKGDKGEDGAPGSSGQGNSGNGSITVEYKYPVGESEPFGAIISFGDNIKFYIAGPDFVIKNGLNWVQYFDTSSPTWMDDADQFAADIEAMPSEPDTPNNP